LPLYRNEKSQKAQSRNFSLAVAVHAQMPNRIPNVNGRVIVFILLFPVCGVQRFALPKGRDSMLVLPLWFDFNPFKNILLLLLMGGLGGFKITFQC